MKRRDRLKERLAVALARGTLLAARILARRRSVASGLRGARALSVALRPLRLARIPRARAERLFLLARAEAVRPPSCWEESLARVLWLSALGHEARLLVGVRRSGSGLEGHAWNGLGGPDPEDGWTPLLAARLK